MLEVIKKIFSKINTRITQEISSKSSLFSSAPTTTYEFIDHLSSIFRTNEILRSNPYELSQKSIWITSAIMFYVRYAKRLNPIIIQQRVSLGDGPPKIIKFHPALDLLFNPNNAYTKTWRSLLDVVIPNLFVYGSAYVVITKRDSRGFPIEIFPIWNSSQMYPVPDDVNGKFIAGYLFKPSSSSNEGVAFAEEDVAWIRIPDIINPYKNLSLVKVAGIEAVTDTAVAMYNYEFFKNDATPTGVLEFSTDVPITLSTMQADQLRQEWERSMSSRYGSSHRIAILRPGVSFKNIQILPHEAEFLKLRHLNKEAIFTLYGIPLGLAQTQQASQDIETQERIFYEASVIPLIQQILDELSILILSSWNNKQRVRYLLKYDVDKSGIRSLQENLAILSQASRMLSGVPIMTPDEVRQMYFGLGHVEGGDTLYANSRTIPLSDLGVVPSEERKKAISEITNKIMSLKHSNQFNFNDVNEIVANYFLKYYNINMINGVDKTLHDLITNASLLFYQYLVKESDLQLAEENTRLFLNTISGIITT